jgi:uncharacterized protein (TIGR03435 family)
MTSRFFVKIAAWMISLSLTSWLAFGQSDEAPPKFEAADVHVSAKTQNPFVRTGPVRGGRYEIKYATMVDLIHLAYGFDNDKILGGPSWLELDRFDLTGKVPADSTPETHKLMLQSLLAERFKLVAHKDAKALPTYALVAGKKPQLKEAEGTEENGCKPQSQSAGGPEAGGMRIMMSSAVLGGAEGTTTTLTLGPGGTVQYACRNMTMDAFVGGLPRMMGAGGSLGTNPVLNDTGLEGKWNFDVRWSIGIVGPAMNQSDRITIFDAVEKQLGLKLEERSVPTPVMVVDSVNEKPTENPPGTADVLPVIPAPTEFEVASIKPSEPGGRGGMMFRTQTGGRFTSNGMPLRALINQAFPANNGDQIAGLPSFVDTERFDIMAKASSDGPASTGTDRETLAPMIRALLVDRFKMTYHTEDRQLTGYSLVAAKPKLKKADPSSRTFCKNMPPPPGAPPATRLLTCQNATLALFAERLQYMAMDFSLPVLDATGIEGGWDFTLTFSMNFGMPMMARGGDAGPGAGPAAPADPTGGLSIFEAMEKELGLKLEKQKRSMPVIVIDHIEQKPTEN